MMTRDDESPSSAASTFSSISWHTKSPRSSSSSRTSRRTQNVLLAALTSVLFLTVVQLTRLSQIPAYIEPDTPAYREPDIDMRTHSRRLKFTPLHSASEESVSVANVADSQPILLKSAEATTQARPKKYAVVNFVDNKAYYLWGIYSIHNQMKKFNMIPDIAHVVLVASDMKRKHKQLLRQWLGKENVIDIDKKFVRDHVPEGVWRTVFSKIEFFNLTQFDKVIGLDNDIFIRQNIAHWFDYPAPAATQARGTIEWNSGAMVIEPNEGLYKKLLEYIPKIHVWNSKTDEGIDGFNSGLGHQGFLSSFFLSNVTNDTMHTMSYGASVLSSDLRSREKANEYFWKYRNEAIETVHLTLEKPWKGKTKPSNPIVCAVLKEWMESVAHAPKDKLQELPDVLVNCEKKDLPDEVSESNEAVPETLKEKAKKLAMKGINEEKAAAIRKKKLIRHRKALAAIKRRRAARMRGQTQDLAPSSSPVGTSTTAGICFVTSIYGSSVEASDIPPDVSELQQEHFPDSKFYLFTNMEDLEAPGWAKVIRHFDYRRYITQSRWPKFMAWKESFIQDCDVVFYMDGYVSPKAERTSDFLELADSIIKSESGLAQNRAPRKKKHTLLAELKYILRSNKDIDANVQAAKQWFQDQTDFKERNHCTVYDNCLIGYDPKNAHFQAAATFFWDHYSMEEDTWRDQPLWAYTLDKFGLEPISLGGKRRVYFAHHWNNLSPGAHRYNEMLENSAISVTVG